MNQDGMYFKIAQEYNLLNREKRELMRKRDNINARIEMIDAILTDLDDILSKHGIHIYEHFEENEPQESEE